MRCLALVFAAFALLASPALLAGEAEVYGRPLRGLSPVPLAEVAAHPERYRGRAVRVAGSVASSASGKLVLSDGGAKLPVESDGSFALPAAAQGAKATAEGKVSPDAVALVATGVEIRR